MEDLKLAILIDADNISPKYVKVILDEAANFGVAACKRIYGDWSDARLKSWKDALLNNSTRPAAVPAAVPTETIRPTAFSPSPKEMTIKASRMGTASKSPSIRIW